MNRPALSPPVLLFCGFMVLFFYLLCIPAEDSVILYDHARNLATRGLVTYGGGQAPIEGATDFLWMVCISLLKRAGMPEYLSALTLNAVGVGVLYRACAGWVRPWVFIAGVLVTPFLYGAGAGFSCLLFSAVFVTALRMFLARRLAAFYATALVMCLFRPDGVVWISGMFATLMVEALRRRSGREILLALLIFVLPGLGYFFGRMAYFGEWLPLPFYVKSSGVRDLVVFHSASLLTCLGVFAPAAWVAWRHRDTLPLKPVLLVTLVPLLFYSAMSLAQNVGDRFLAPMFFGMAYLVLRHSGEKAFVVLFLLVAVGSGKETVLGLKEVLTSRSVSVYYTARDLATVPPGGKMSVTEAGRLAYYSGWLTHDSWGLNTPAYARQPVSEADFERERYDLINAHCSLTMLAGPPVAFDHAQRRWEHQCLAITNFLKGQGADYRLLLLPFFRDTGLMQPINLAKARLFGSTSLGCRRHDLYAVDARSPRADAIVEVLKRNGAIDYRPDLRIEHDRLC